MWGFLPTHKKRKNKNKNFALSYKEIAKAEYICVGLFCTVRETTVLAKYIS